MTTFIIAGETKKPVDKALSFKPQLKTHFLAIMKLENPALLEKPNANGKIDEELKAAILKEQEEAIARLLKISPEIQILHRYRLVLNALSIIAPNKVLKKIHNLAGTSYIEQVSSFSRPHLFQPSQSQLEETDFSKTNSVKFIGAEKAQGELTAIANGVTTPINGKGISVGIIDTGIDYTHKMLGGIGDPEVYKNLDPNTSNNYYPNKKVIGGVDFVGTDYNSGSLDFKLHIPKPDFNPLDEGGHGTHVGGTVAGIGDGIHTYSGVAPQANLYALKVFGKKGSTGDSVIIAALEWAADPNQDLDPSDRLDVVNLSLGSNYGKPYLLYQQAMKNLIAGGTLVAASAGNSGHHSYIVGAPGTVKEAISVAASVDDMPHNWQFSMVQFLLSNGSSKTAEAVEANMTKPIADLVQVEGELIAAGTAAKDFDEALKEKLKGKVALIDRGKVAFGDKIKRAAEAGCIGVVVANNAPGDAFSMGGDGEFEIPAIMITQALGDLLKEDMKTGAPSIKFKTDEKLKRPELIDTLTSFSSRGPRSQDGLLKPEISAPGYNIVSADMGKRRPRNQAKWYLHGRTSYCRSLGLIKTKIS